MTTELAQLYARDLDKVITDLEAFSSEEDLWKISGDVKNSAGNLGLHIAGNLLHFIGAQIGGSDYVRNRPFEFEGRNVPLQEIIDQINQAKSEIIRVLPSLTDEQLAAPLDNIPYDLTTGGFILHLYHHMGYHAGQINYLRRLMQ